jgi:uroporphyrinogen decarboxylase
VTSIERVRAAARHEEPDRVPVDVWLAPEARRLLMAHFGAAGEWDLLGRLGCDFRRIEGPHYVGPALESRPDGVSRDLWGVWRRPVTVKIPRGEARYLEVSESPLADARSAAEVESYPHWPSPDDFDYSVVRDQALTAGSQGHAVLFAGDRLNRCAQLKPAMYLRGVDRILMDLALAPDIADAIFARVRGFYVEYARRVLEAAGGAIDVFMTGDDFGHEGGMLMSPETWRRCLRPGFADLVRVGKEAGALVMHHSCGSIRPIIGDMIDAGLDILNPVQPEAADMEPAELKREFGDRLTFHGSVSIQRTLPFGTPDEVRAEVAERVRLLATGGGFVLCTAHNIQADVPLENILALFDAYREFGSYAG